MEYMPYLCLVGMMLFGGMAIMTSRLLHSAAYLALASVCTGLLMYLMGAPWAAVFEISVCSGLVTVIFISAVSLTNIGKAERKEAREEGKHTRLLPLIVVLIGIVLVLAAVISGFHVEEAVLPTSAEFWDVFWNQRQPDLWGQMIALVIGAAAIVVFFGERD